MPFYVLNRFSLLFLAVSLFPSCVSKKKHQTSIDTLNTQYQEEVAQLQDQVDSNNEKIRNLELNLAERIGENNILLMLRNELQDEVTLLQENIENLNNSSTSAQQSLSADLAKKDQRIRQLKNILSLVDTTIFRHENLIRRVTADLNLIAKEYPTDIEVNFGFDFSTIDISESFLFKNNSATRLESNGLKVLEQFAQVFQKYPEIKIQIVGHTDTSPPKEIRRYLDNWNFSALQSATVVRTLIDEFDVNANQLILAAKSSSAPKASNSTEEGRSKNRRIEMILVVESENLAKEIRKVLAKAK